MVFSAGALWAQQTEPSFKVQAPETVFEGQVFQVQYVLTTLEAPKKMEWPVPKKFEKMKVLSGPNTSSSKKFEVINGKSSLVYTFTYNYKIEAQKKGEVVFPEAVAVIGKTKVPSDTPTLTIVKE